jgi:DNA-binding CsgD family transcriptional regulator
VKIVPNPAYAAATILKLSAREFEVFCDIACGITPTETAEKTGLSVKTVSTYRQRIIDKLGVRSNQEIAVLAFREGITKVEDEIQEPARQASFFPSEADPRETDKPQDRSENTSGSSPAVGENV